MRQKRKQQQKNFKEAYNFGKYSGDLWEMLYGDSARKAMALISRLKGQMGWK